MCRVRVVSVGRASFAASAQSASHSSPASLPPALCEADTEITVVPKRDCRIVSAGELTGGSGEDGGGLGDQIAHIPLLTAAAQPFSRPQQQQQWR